MGSKPANQDWYVLRVPMSIEGFGAESAQAGSIAYIYINGVLISEAYQEPSHQSIPLPIVIGNPAETVRMSIRLLLGGNPPVASDLIITPGDPKTSDDLSGSYSYHDDEQNPESGLTEIRWYKDGQPQATYDDTLAVPSSATAKGQQWYFTVRPHDGFKFGSTEASDPVTIGNTGPVASDPDISPASPLTDDDLTADYSYSDTDGDPENGSEIRWYKDGSPESGYDDMLIVPSSATAKGQQWHFTVKPKDGADFGAIQTSDPVTVGNTQPEASDPIITPSSPFTGDDLMANYGYSDADGDPESGTTIRWYRNESMQSAYNDEKTVPSSATAKGQQWHFTVRPGDGTELGSYKTSPNVTIGNTSPAASIPDISPASPLTGDNLVASYSYSDIDDDPESGTEIRWYKNGDVQSDHDDMLTVLSGATAKGQQWYFTVRPYDGANFGTVQSSATTAIGNTPPTASVLSIFPASPLSDDALVGSYNYNDVDGDPENGSEIRWYKDGSPESDYDDILTVPSSATAKGQQWHFTVKPNDGTDSGAIQASEPVTVGNGAPVASNLSISPESPTTYDDLVGSYDYSDADGDPENGTEIRWYKNDNVQAAYDNMSTLPSSATAGGQQWHFTVRPGDGINFGAIQASPPVTISNTAPMASDPVISPASPLTGDDLVANYSYSDADGDPENGTEIKWYRNGSVQAAYDNMSTLPFSATAKGQQWHFTVRPMDGADFGALQTSDPVIIGNTRALASSPVISPSSPLTEDDLVASYVYSDADGDPESGTTIRWYKNDNMQSNYNDSMVLPSNATVKGQQWRFTVRPGDGTELGPYKTAPTVTIGNTPPVADAGGPYEAKPGEEIIFDGSGSLDADDDSLVTYSWDFGDTSFGQGETPSHLYAGPGMYLVTLVVNDGTADSAPSTTTAYLDDDPSGTPSAPFNLELGWNLISIPKQPLDTSIDSVLSSIQGKYDSIIIYDASAGIWLKYVVYGPLFLCDLNELAPGAGYWVKMNQPGILVVQGTEPATAVPLRKGWNSVGYNSETSRAIEDCMYSIDGKYNSISTYDSDEKIWLRYTPDGPPSLNSLKFMEAGRGYLIDVREDCIWDMGS